MKEFEKCTSAKECGKPSRSGQRQHTKVVQKRDKIYPGGYKGWEIAKEIKVCSECLSK